MKIGGQQVPTRTLALALSESVLVIIGLLAAIPITGIIRGTGVLPLRWSALVPIVLVAITFELVLYYTEIYDLPIQGNRAAVTSRLLQAFGTASISLALIYLIAPGLALQKGVVVVATPLSLFLIIGWRRFLGSSGFLLQKKLRVAVVGTGAVGIALVREVLARPEINWNVVGFMDQDPNNVGKPLVNPGIIATIADVQQVVHREKINRIVISLKQGDQLPAGAMMRLKLEGVAIEDASDVLERLTGRLTLEDPAWLIRTHGFQRSKFLSFTKRALDILTAVASLVVTLPLSICVACLIVAESGFPILFRQKRVGLNGKTFEMLKFRSMYQGSEASGPKWAADGDSRITPLGRIIRKYRIDEFPQLWNVLLGDMSLVGPRPEQPYFCELLEKQIPFFEQRHHVRPGITGWAQVKYRYGSSVEDARRKLEFDLFYIKHLSLLLDTIIILETIKVVLWARGSK